MNEKTVINYIYDMSILIKEMALEAKINKEKGINSETSNYQIGYLMALHDVISLMKQQADAFEIDQKLIGLADIEPDDILL